MNLVFIRHNNSSKEYEAVTEEDVLQELRDALANGVTVSINNIEFWIDDAGD